MLKFLFCFIASGFVVYVAKCQHADTTIIYLKNNGKASRRVSSLESADFFRMILPPDSSDNRVNVKEFYKNGTRKFVGKYEPINTENFPESLSGDCINYYPNGKKASICHYTKNQKDGNEYLFYPNGTIYCYKTNSFSDIFHLKTKYLECYDANGTMISSGGDGQWLEYDNDFKNILNSGPVKHGYKEGEWHCRTGDADSIKYTCRFNKNVFVSGIGYDKNGTAYRFTKEAEWANYNGGVITFIDVFKRHLTLPKGPDGNKMPIDTMHITFVVEKDGHVTGFKTLGNVNPDLNKALEDALTKCGDWTPCRLYGVPLRTEIIVPLSFVQGYSGDSYRKEVSFKTRVLGY